VTLWKNVVIADSIAPDVLISFECLPTYFVLFVYNFVNWPVALTIFHCFTHNNTA